MHPNNLRRTQVPSEINMLDSGFPGRRREAVTPFPSKTYCTSSGGKL